MASKLKMKSEKESARQNCYPPLTLLSSNCEMYSWKFQHEHRKLFTFDNGRFSFIKDIGLAQFIHLILHE